MMMYSSRHEKISNLGSLDVISGDILDRSDGTILYFFFNFFQVYEAYKMAAPSRKVSKQVTSYNFKS